MNRIYLNRYNIVVGIISVMVAFLTHMPEMISLSGNDALFPGIRVKDVVNEVIFTLISLLLLFYLNTRIFRYNMHMVNIGWKQLLLSFAFTWILSSLLGKGFVFLHHHFDIPAIDSMLHNYMHPLRDFLMSSIVVGTCYLVHLNKKSQIVMLDNQKLRTENLLSQYETLKNQLNPHMLFNSLNTLYSLIRENPDKAQSYVQELSKVLRYTLQDSENHLVTLEEEMSFVHSYIYMLKVRYEDNLQFDIRLHPSCTSRKLPTMSVQMLIENAVKHNEISNRKPLVIRIMAEDSHVVVSNHIQPKLTSDASTQIGLDNLSRRYRLLAGKEVEIRTDDDNFTVILPII